MNVFQWTVAGTAELPTLNFGLLEQWLQEVARSHGKLVGDLNYVFCDDEEILRVNRQFLDHDYYTDIITFDRSGRGVVRGDMYISLDTVQSNAVDCRAAYDTELNRVVVHGLLHLCGINDKGPGEREIMERHEDEALSLLKSITTGNEV
ncbi:MAG: rRNA maturation RNase YbeY [Muribaculaceae bacterium]|nr:rRNA maturation RNase YbeY [Muribaculaceae bacterium]